MFWRKSKLLILYSTVDGHTKDICNYIYKKLKGRKKVTIISVEDPPPPHDEIVRVATNK